MILTFTAYQFSSFKRYTQRLEFEDCAVPFPDGEDRAMLETPSKEINLAFTKDEWADFSFAMDEAGVIKEFYYMLHG